ncbi:LytTR family DNA-binding domain-containing protein [Pedobacter nototheniae]|uniref:LytR/AlgR family response regulator transcription factor n=1 Tax=Pedobacter nototheniae TaxID=2488994 RepID=UPI00292E7780|nr:LytTR family DNA-binding domain-containing protein [Pedobacter nototheniae]
MNYNCLVIDDNEIERDAIEMQLRKIPSLNIIAVCENALEAMQVLATQKIDIVFSDIDMPGLSGLDLLKSTLNKPAFIFITSYTEYAVEGFNLDALDFIVKPASFERLLKAANKAIEYLTLKNILNRELTESNKAEADTDDFFFFKETKGISKLYYSDVVYVESMGDFSKIYTQKGMHVTLVNLKNLEIQFPSNSFLRVHKQYIVNLKHISTLTNHEIHLNHNFVVPVSITVRQQLLDQMNEKTITRFLK